MVSCRLGIAIYSPLTMRHYEPRIEKLRRTGVVLIDDQSLVLSMEEKPAEPLSTWAVPPFYIYKKEDLEKLPQAIEDGCNTDAPGSFIAWLCTQTTVYAYEMPGKRYDIGNLESYEQVQKDYKGIS